jgi:hypothetical protein
LSIKKLSKDILIEGYFKKDWFFIQYIIEFINV